MVKEYETLQEEICLHTNESFSHTTRSNRCWNRTFLKTINDGNVVHRIAKQTISDVDDVAEASTDDIVLI